MARSAKDDALDPIAKQQVFRRAFGTLNKLLDEGNLISAFVLSFSILEDRVRAAMVACYKRIGEPVDTSTVSDIPFGKVVGRLKRINAIDHDLELRLRAAGDLRNRLTHQMMWRLDVFREEDVKSFQGLINDVKRSHRRFLVAAKR